MKDRISFKIIVLGFVIGFLGYIPVFWTPNCLNEIYLRYHWIIIPSSLVVVFALSINLSSKWKYFYPLGFILLMLLSPQLREISNRGIILFNKGRELPSFKSPYLGYKLEYENSHEYQIMGDAGFIYNISVFDFTYEAIIFDKDHNYNMESFDGDDALQKIYNDDWWKYLHYD